MFSATSWLTLLIQVIEQNYAPSHWGSDWSKYDVNISDVCDSVFFFQLGSYIHLTSTGTATRRSCPSLLSRCQGLQGCLEWRCHQKLRRFDQVVRRFQRTLAIPRIVRNNY